MTDRATTETLTGLPLPIALWVAVGVAYAGVRWRDVDILEELDYAVELGILRPPAMAIDGVLVFPALPDAERLRQALMEKLERVAQTSGER